MEAFAGELMAMVAINAAAATPPEKASRFLTVMIGDLANMSPPPLDLDVHCRSSGSTTNIHVASPDGLTIISDSIGVNRNHQ